MKLLPVVMVRAPRQQENVNRWLDHSESLNPYYDIDILDAPIEFEAAKVKQQDASFRVALDKYRGQAFLWVEPDSIPLSHDWLEEITAEYYKAGKPFMLPIMLSLGDIGSGIGVYPPEASYLIPESFSVHAWDAWVYRNMTPAIHFTELIQHSYGVYAGMHLERRHAFPKDQLTLNMDTALFHADPMQTLIRHMPRFYHTGDIGDLIAVLPIIKQLGGGEVFIGEVDRKLPRGKIPRGSIYDQYDQIVSLLEMQDYVTGVYKLSVPAEVQGSYDFSSFRLVNHLPHENLIQWQARAVGLGPIDESPWLKCGAHIAHERVVVARSPRYHNPFFPWKAIAEYYKNRLLFVGSIEEHASFQHMIGQPIEHTRTPTLLDAAKAIMGASLVFCNQSAPYWIAAGLGKPLVQECWVGGHMNSIIKRDNASYVTTDISKIARLLNIPL